MSHPAAIPDQITYDNEMSPASMTPERIGTDRLILRQIHPDHVDASDIHSLFHDLTDPDEVFQYCSWTYHKNLDDTREFINMCIREWENAERARYVIQLRETGEYMGSCYIQFSPRISNCEIGFWLRKQHWGEEYTGELSDAFVDIVFNDLRLNYVFIGCLSKNKKSRSAIEKLIDRYGGDYYGTTPVDAQKYDDTVKKDVAMHHEYMITQDQYRDEETGISCTVPGVSYDEISFN